MDEHTLWLREVTLLNTDLDGLVELCVEGSTDLGDLVVGNDILLDSLSAIMIR